MKLKKIIFILALLIFLGALGYLGVVWYSYYSAGKVYEELEEAVVTRQEGTDTGEEGEGAEAVWEPPHHRFRGPAGDLRKCGALD
ncbi:hypothetical protein CLS_33770 [[Clostridium] cf. saccharolyticum K10]|nr:hypothetical protein CLS_33770 [[Clostridium] cf. saccharolyticum K10]